MGASASVNTVVNDITNRVKQEIQQSVQVVSDADCKVTIGSIVFSETNGCTISVENLCTADATGEVQAILNASIDFYNELNVDQKQEAATWFTATVGVNTTVNTIINDFTNIINQTCLSESNVNSTIEVQNITVSKCTAPPREGILTFNFINTGHATGICAISLLNNILVTGSNEVATKQSQGLDWSTLIWPICVLGIFVVVAMLLYYIKQLVVKPQDRISMELAKNNSPVIQFGEYYNLIKKRA